MSVGKIKFSPVMSIGRKKIIYWSQEDADRLFAIVKSIGTHDWVKVANIFNLSQCLKRTAKQCREKCHNSSRVSSKFSQEEILAVFRHLDFSSIATLTQVRQWRNAAGVVKWGEIIKKDSLFTGRRTSNDLKNVFHSVLIFWERNKHLKLGDMLYSYLLKRRNIKRVKGRNFTEIAFKETPQAGSDGYEDLLLGARSNGMSLFFESPEERIATGLMGDVKEFDF